MSEETPPLTDMPQDGELWHLQGLGSVSRDDAGARIEVVMVRAQVAAPRRPDDFDNTKPCVAKMFVGYLPMLRMGTFWRNGVEVHYKYPKQQLVTLTGIEVNSETLKETHIGYKPDDKYFLVPPQDHRLFIGKARLDNSRVLGITYNNDAFGIIVPTTELIRFYYARSSKLARAVFDGTFTHDANSIYNSDSTGPMNIGAKKRMVVHRRQDYADADCWAIGRILLSSEANQGAKMIHDRLQTQKLRNKPMYPTSQLPFQGTANWQVRGIRLLSGRWLVQELIACTALFPFDELEVIADNDPRQTAHDPPRDERLEAYRGAHETRAAKEADRMDSKMPPNTTRVGIDVKVRSLSQDQLGDIAGKQIIRTEKAACRYKSGNYGAVIPPGENAGNFSAGDPSYVDSTHAEAKVTSGSSIDDAAQRHRAAALRASLPGLRDLTLELARKGIAAQIRRSTTDMHLPLLGQQSYRKGSKKGSWAYLNPATQARRAVMAVDIFTERGPALAVEFEMRPTEHYRLALFYGTEVTDAMLEELLQRLVRKQGVWVNIEPLKGVRLKPFKHSSSNYDRFATRIADFLSNLPVTPPIIGDSGEQQGGDTT